MISFEEFENLASQFNVVPLQKTMPADLHTPVSVYLALREGARASFLLESAEANDRIGRYSFVGANPHLVVTSRGSEVEVLQDGVTTTESGDIVSVLKRLQTEFHQAPIAAADGFSGGFLGYMGYDEFARREGVALPAADGESPPESTFGFYHSFVRLDHRGHTLTAVHNVVVNPQKSLREQYEEGNHRLETLLLKLSRIPTSSATFSCDLARMQSGTAPDTYCEMVRQAKDHIFEGDVFQVVLSRRISLPFTGDPFPVYRALRIINPSPYLFYVRFDDLHLIGSSPEVLVRVQSEVVEVLPIAGTRPRGQTEDEDRRLEEELRQDEKECAEHAMLVDLGRNDVGRVSELNSVQVPVQARVDRYSHVMHMVSEVRGRLKDNFSSLDALLACSPAGTVSGAPKIRAMEIISDLEGRRRGIYAGGVGYIGLSGSLDTCIAIRTIIAQGSMLQIQTGAGIVAGSVPEKEYAETENKAKALVLAVEMAMNGLQSDRVQKILEEHLL